MRRKGKKFAGLETELGRDLSVLFIDPKPVTGEVILTILCDEEVKNSLGQMTWWGYSAYNFENPYGKITRKIGDIHEQQLGRAVIVV